MEKHNQEIAQLNKEYAEFQRQFKRARNQAAFGSAAAVLVLLVLLKLIIIV